MNLEWKGYAGGAPAAFVSCFAAWREVASGGLREGQGLGLMSGFVFSMAAIGVLR